MLGVLCRCLERRRRSRAAITAAIRHLEATTGEHGHAGISAVIGEHAGGAVVRVCYGHTRPPQRVWYVVAANGSVVAELSLAEAAGFGERRWR